MFLNRLLKKEGPNRRERIDAILLVVIAPVVSYLMRGIPGVIAPITQLVCLVVGLMMQFLLIVDFAICHRFAVQIHPKKGVFQTLQFMYRDNLRYNNLHAQAIKSLEERRRQAQAELERLEEAQATRQRELERREKSLRHKEDRIIELDTALRALKLDSRSHRKIVGVMNRTLKDVSFEGIDQAIETCNKLFALIKRAQAANTALVPLLCTIMSIKGEHVHLHLETLEDKVIDAEMQQAEALAAEQRLSAMMRAEEERKLARERAIAERQQRISRLPDPVRPPLEAMLMALPLAGSDRNYRMAAYKLDEAIRTAEVS